MHIREILAADQVGFPVLSTLIFLPLAGALLVLAIGDDRRARRAALAISLIELLLSLFVLARFVTGTPDVQFAERRPWIPTLGASYHLGVDGMSVLFLPVAALLSVLVLVASWREVKARARGHNAALLALSAMVMGIFSSLDLVLFFVFWEASLIPMYFLVSLFGVGPERRYAAMKFVLTMLTASGPLLLGIVLLAVAGRESPADPYTFDWLVLRERPVPPSIGPVVFFTMLIGFAVKGPFVPLHTWMPTMLRECPVGIGVLLTGLKLGCYGVLRFLVPLLPEATARHAWLLGALGVTAIVYGALVALVQPNLRRLLSFSCLSHVGFVLLGISSGSTEGLSGAVLVMLNLGLSATGLFFLTGFLQNRVGSSEVSALGGVAQKAPRAAVMFLLLGLAGIGLPGTSGFPGEHLVLLSAYETSLPSLVLALFGTILGAAYVLRVFERVFLGPVTRPRVAAMKDLRPLEWGVVGCLAILVLVVGLHPRPLLEIVGPSAEALARPSGPAVVARP
ncbi:complex I subunit 4 family protein [Polyangium spumosum]|uniref:NADH-quinone oxidoreductase subunit M n=1 Tax=Polyangium spumosum TaxID=889282 RepID=A0A6N7PJ49_9BACT|nr:NADH-quinone oxidoreductase subunit M [Polyangium spumosum]MRG92018.1 NADH-quinone oxidoreductase subunit M [Polyangium spumosum]